MQTSFARYIYSANSICFCYAKSRYDINLVAARQHIECVSTYRVIYDISKILQEIYIDEKKTFFFVEKCLFFWRHHPDLNRGIRVLQTHALPLGYGATFHLMMQRDAICVSLVGANDEARTRSLHLGKVALYQMSYIRTMVPPDGIEPSTRGFSVLCSTD